MSDRTGPGPCRRREDIPLSHHILVVDDDEAVRVMLSRLLESQGFVTARAGDAADARRLLAERQYALGIVDIVMPGESGLEFAAFARESNPSMPIILISGYVNDDAIPLVETDAAVRFVGKPFGADEILDLVQLSLA